MYKNLPYFNGDKKDLLRYLNQKISKKQTPIQIATVNPEFILESRKNTAFFQTLQNSLCVVDGKGLQSALSLFASKKYPRITGSDFIYDLMAFSEQKKLRVALVGAQDGVAEKTASKLKEKYSELHVVYAWVGYFAESEKRKFLNQLQVCKPDVVCVAFWASKQELFISEDLFRYVKSVKIAIGLGGTFDYVAGEVDLAPDWMRVYGIEWLYRLITQPSRWKRIMNAVIIFPLYVFWLFLTRQK